MKPAKSSTIPRRRAPKYLSALALATLALCQAPAKPQAPQAKQDEVKDQGGTGSKAAPMAGYPEGTPFDLAIAKSNFPAPAGAIFVAPGALEGGAGTQQSPMTLARAIESAPAGSTIVLRGGEYRVGGLAIKRKLALQAFPGELPLLLGSVVVNGWAEGANARGKVWRHAGWQKHFPNTLAPRMVDPKRNPMAANRDAAFLDDRALWQAASLDEVGPGRFFVDYEKKELVIGDDPTGRQVEATDKGVGLLFAKPRPGEAGFETVDPSGSSVRGLSFGRYADQGVSLVRASDVMLEASAFSWNGQHGAAIYESPGVLVKDCRLVCNGRSALSGNDAHRLRLEGNEFAHSNIEGYSTSWDAAAVKFTRSNSMVWARNSCHDTHAIGLWIDVTCLDNQVVGNVGWKNAVGFMAELSDETIVAFNTFYDNGEGINVTDASNTRIWNNTLARNRVGIVVQDSPRRNDKPAGWGYVSGEVATRCPWITHGTVVKNNLLWGTGGKAPLFNGSGGWTTGEASALFVSQSGSNAYGRTDAAKPALGWSWGTKETRHVSYPTLADFRRAAQAANLSHEANSVEMAGDPFVDAAANDFRLKPNSTLLSGGEALPEDVARAGGKAAGQRLIGAHGA